MLKIFQAFIALIHFGDILADIIEYRDHIISPAKPEYLIIPKYSSADVPKWPPGHGHSYIDLSPLILKADCSQSSLATCESTNVDFELLMFQLPSDKAWNSYWPNSAFCCNAEEIEEGQ